MPCLTHFGNSPIANTERSEVLPDAPSPADENIQIDIEGGGCGGRV